MKYIPILFAIVVTIITITLSLVMTMSSSSSSSPSSFFFVDAARRPTPYKPSTHHYAEVQEHPHMPDRHAPDNKRALQCSSCKVLTDEVWQRLHALARANKGKPRHFQQVDVIEAMCKEVKHEYGLVLRNGKPVMEFSRDDAIETLKGTWINDYVEHRCGKILASHEEQILEKYKQVRDLAEFQQVICKKLDRSCLTETFVPNGDL